MTVTSHSKPLFALLMVVFAACQSTQLDPDAAREQSLQMYLTDDASAIAYANALPACESMVEHDIAPGKTGEGPVAPTPIRTCIRNYPPIPDEVGYVAHCTVTFDISEDGEPIDLFTGCTTEHYGNIDNPERFAARADLVFETMANRAVEQSRFLPLSEEVPGAKRKAIVRYVNFIYLREALPATTSEIGGQ